MSGDRGATGAHSKSGNRSSTEGSGETARSSSAVGPERTSPIGGTITPTSDGKIDSSLDEPIVAVTESSALSGAIGDNGNEGTTTGRPPGLSGTQPGGGPW